MVQLAYLVARVGVQRHPWTKWTNQAKLIGIVGVLVWCSERGRVHAPPIPEVLAFAYVLAIESLQVST